MRTSLVIFCLCGLLTLTAGLTSAEAYTISLNPFPSAIQQGGNTTVNVDISLGGQESLYGFDLSLLYDPAIVRFSGFSTSLLNPSDSSDPLFDYVGGYANIDPFVSFNGFFLPWDPLTSPLSGDFTLASLTFTGLALGTSPLDLSGTLLIDPAGAQNDVMATGKVDVVPEPGSLLLLGTGLAGFFAVFRRKRAEHRNAC